jgi:glycosyltransferase involved in cell wall biosynthesis
VNRILIVSILKPVNDPRMYEKFGISISGMDKVEVHIAGFKAAGENQEAGSGKWGERIIFHPLFNFKRISWGRIFAPWKLLKLLFKVKPHIIVVTTFELLIVTILYKILFGGVLLYDIQENYYRNITYNKTYPPVIRNILATYSRCIEYLSRPFVNKYILAERNYEKEFSFSRGKSIIIENKYKNLKNEPSVLNRQKPIQGNSIKLLYSGTISEGYGIFEAIDLAERLHKINQNITLNIIGYCSNFHLFKKIKNEISDKNFISLSGGGSLVSHHQIIEEIKKADFGLLSYQPNPSTENCVPTRLFEYQAHLLPMIIQENRLWKEICEPNHSAIFIDYKKFDPANLYEQMLNQSFYPNGASPENLWNSEEEKLRFLIKDYIK